MKNQALLVAYFSRTGNTRVLAQQVHRMAGGDLFEIVPLKPYPADYDAVVDQARDELDRDFRPALKTAAPAMGPFTTVLVGYPNWWGTIPRPVATFLSEHNLAGKTIAPFCTHGGGGMGRSVAEIRALCPDSTVPDGLAVPGGSVNRAENAVAGWLMKIGIPPRT